MPDTERHILPSGNHGGVGPVGPRQDLAAGRGLSRQGMKAVPGAMAWWVPWKGLQTHRILAANTWKRRHPHRITGAGVTEAGGAA